MFFFRNIERLDIYLPSLYFPHSHADLNFVIATLCLYSIQIRDGGVYAVPVFFQSASAGKIIHAVRIAPGNL